jgi:hypothetical protein
LYILNSSADFMMMETAHIIEKGYYQSVPAFAMMDVDSLCERRSIIYLYRMVVLLPFLVLDLVVIWMLHLAPTTTHLFLGVSIIGMSFLLILLVYVWTLDHSRPRRERTLVVVNASTVVEGALPTPPSLL